MSNRQNYLTALDSMVGGELPLHEGEKIIAINMAIKEHSRHKPLEVVEDITGDGGFDYAVSDLESWEDGFSSITRVEYPVDDDDEIADVLDDDEWIIYSKPTGDVLRFLKSTPESTEEARVTYVTTHTCSDSTCTVKGFDDEAVQALAAAFFCSLLSSYYAQSNDSTINADSVNHKSKSDDYEAKSKMYRKLYYNHIGTKDGGVRAASVTRDQDTKASWASDKLTHLNKYR